MSGQPVHLSADAEGHVSGLLELAGYRNGSEDDESVICEYSD